MILGLVSFILTCQNNKEREQEEEDSPVQIKANKEKVKIGHSD